MSRKVRTLKLSCSLKSKRMNCQIKSINWRKTLGNQKMAKMILIRSMLNWRRNMSWNASSLRLTLNKIRHCSLRGWMRLKHSLKKPKTLSRSPSKVGLKKRRFWNRNLNSSNTNLMTRRRSTKSRDQLMIQWLRVFRHQTESQLLEEKRLRARLMKWNRSSWMKGRIKKINTMIIDLRWSKKMKF